MNAIALTIFTPTYNRESELKRLYESLSAQTVKRFEWLICDDGSTDETESIISDWAERSSFQIRYFKQENSGKHVAHNKGALKAAGHYFICVDSDDWLESNAVETILKDTAKLDKLEGLLYPKKFSNQASLDEWFPDDVTKIELADMRLKFGLAIETALVFNTEVLKTHPFPVVSGENYLPEESAYYDFLAPELFVVRCEPFYRCEYLDKGLTNNIWNNWLKNPRGTQLALEKRYQAAGRYTGVHAMKGKVSAIVGIESLHMACRKHSPYPSEMRSVLSAAVFPISLVLRAKRFGVSRK